MGLLTQLIADHHNAETQKQAQQIGMWKGILEDKRPPEDGGFTVEMKNHALEQMVGMANGGKQGKGGAGGGGKGKAGEMLGVFQHLLGLHPGGNGKAADQQDQPMQNAAAQSGPMPQQAQQQQAQNTDDPGAPGQGVQPGGQPQSPAPQQVAAPQPLQRTPQPAQRPGRPVIPGRPSAFMTQPEMDARRAELASQARTEAGKDAEATGVNASKQADRLAQMKAEGVKGLIDKGWDKAEAEEFYGVKPAPLVHKIGATDKFERNGKPFIRTYYSDGSSKEEEDITTQPTGSGAKDGLTGNARNLNWALKHKDSTDPVEAETASRLLADKENDRLMKDIQFKTKGIQLTNLRNATDPSSIATIADGVRQGITDPNLTNMSRATATLVTAQLARDGFNQAAAKQEYNATKTGLAALNGPQQVRLRQNVEQAKESLPLIYDAGKQWSDAMKLSGKNPVLNSGELVAAEQGVYGQQAQAAAVVFEGQIADVQAELSSIYMGTSAPTDKAIELAQKSLKSNWSWATLQAQLQQVDKNLQRRDSAISHITIMGSSVDSTYVPKAADGQVKGVGEVGKGSGDGAKVSGDDWKTKPDANGVITRPDGQRFKKTDKGYIPLPKTQAK